MANDKQQQWSSVREKSMAEAMEILRSIANATRHKSVKDILESVGLTPNSAEVLIHSIMELRSIPSARNLMEGLIDALMLGIELAERARRTN